MLSSFSPPKKRWAVSVDPGFKEMKGQRFTPPRLSRLGIADLHPGFVETSTRLTFPEGRQLIVWLENVSAEAVTILVPGHKIRFDWDKTTTLDGSGRKRVSDLGGVFRVWTEANGQHELIKPYIEAVNGAIRVHEARLKGETTWVR